MVGLGDKISMVRGELLSPDKVGLMHDAQTSHDRFSSKKVNDIRKSDKLKNPAATSYGEFSSLSTVAAEILIFVVLSVPLAFFISRDV